MSDGIKVSFGDISVGLEDIRRLVATEWPIVRNRAAVISYEPDAGRERAEKAELELADARRDIAAVNAALTDATATNEALRAEITSVNRELAQAEIRANYQASR
jgi:septal ring factor EnvC (AmiA/AmiB activator)